MERPSHIIATLQVEAVPRRMTVMGFSVGVQALFLSLFVMGVATTAIDKSRPFTVTPAEETVIPETPPPLPQEIRPVLPAVAPPVITTFDPLAGNGALTTTTPDTARPLPVMPPPKPLVVTVSDRAASVIPETRTIPPYPPMERRLGMEGRVTLRLTVQPDGRVAQTEVVKSSGRPALDQAAQQWITTHWAYRPAIRNGVPAAAQVLAAVNFTLTNP
jgi:protein TonB